MSPQNELRKCFDIIGLLFLYITISDIVLNFAFIKLVIVIFNIEYLTLTQWQICATINYIIIFVSTILIGKKLFANNHKFLIPTTATKIGFLLPATIMGVGIALVSNILASLTSMFLSEINIDVPYVPPDVGLDPFSVLLIFVSYAVLPALCEEILFRGIILQPLRKFGNGFAIILSSLAFGLAHSSVPQVIAGSLTGLFLGLVTVRTGSISTACLIHFTYNAIGVLSLYAQVNPTAQVAFIATYLFFLVTSVIAAIFFKYKFYKIWWVPNQTQYQIPSSTKIWQAATSLPLIFATFVCYAKMLVYMMFS